MPISASSSTGSPPGPSVAGVARGLSLLVYPLFFASGAAGLIYEVVWTRMLLYVFGAGLFAVCAVLAAFMAGLALGSWLLGRVSDRLARPLRLYAGLEAAIAAAGLLVPFILTRAGAADGWAYQAFGDNFAMLTVFRFLLAFLVMLVPTTLMGATLPVLSRFMVRQREHLGLHVGGLYAINTLGAVAGVFAAGFVLIGRFGVLQSEFIAVGMNLLVGVGALAVSLKTEKWAQPPERPTRSESLAVRPRSSMGPSTRLITRFVLLAVFLSGGVALAAQVLWTRSLVFLFEYLKNTTYAFSAMLTVFLAGLAIGSGLIGLIVDRQRYPLRLYGILLNLIGMSIFFSVIVLHLGGEGMILADPYDPQTGLLSWPLAVINVMFQSIGVLFVPTLLMGMAFPVAARVVVQMGRVGTDVGRLYALNTIGAIVGSVAAGFLIVPLFGLTKGLILLGCVDALLGLTAMLITTHGRLHVKLFGVLTVAMLVVTYQAMSHRHGLHQLLPNERQVFYEEGPLATVSVLENQIGHRTLYVDSVGVAGTDWILQTDQKSLAHVPMLLLPEPRSALTVGFGSGGCSYSLTLHDQLEQIHCVEISPTVPAAAPYLTAANHGLLGRFKQDHLGRRLLQPTPDPRYKLIFDDARAYLRYTDHTYDFIATDCTDLRYKSNASLYDLDYFRVCREHLTEDGIVVVWMPLAGLSLDIFKVALRTFHRVFPDMGIFFMDNAPTHYILMIGWQEPFQFDFQRMQDRLDELDVRQDLKELYLDDPVKLLSCFVTGGDEVMDAYLNRGSDRRLNTRNHPVIEFESPKYGYWSRPLIDNLKDLLTVRVEPHQFVKPNTMPPETLERLKRFERAMPLIVEGHNSYRQNDLEAATRFYLQAHEQTPSDLSLKVNQLSFPLLQKRVQAEPANPVPRYLLGRVYMIQQTPGKLRQAYDLLDQARDLYLRRLEQEPDNQLYRTHLRQAGRWLVQIEQMIRTSEP